jgi:hypothetical protein
MTMPQIPIDVLAEEGDGSYLTELRLFGLMPLRRFDVADFGRASDNAIVSWTAQTRDAVVDLERFAAVAAERRFMLLSPDQTPIPPALANLRRLEWTKPADIYWQWRIANGAPADHVNRPLSSSE